MKNYLHAKSHHRTSQKIDVLNTLVVRAVKISNKEHLKKYKDHLTKAIQNIGYKKRYINKAFEKA